MTLREYLLTIKKQKKVYIGTFSGSAYLYCGDIDLENIEIVLNSYKARLETLRHNYLVRLDNGDPSKDWYKNYKKNLDSVEQKIAAWVNPMDRDVKMTYVLRLDKNVRAVLIEGKENGHYWFEGDETILHNIQISVEFGKGVKNGRRKQELCERSGDAVID